MVDERDGEKAAGAQWNEVPFLGLEYVSYSEIAFETGRKTSTIKYHVWDGRGLIPAPDVSGRPGLAPIWRADRDDLLRYVYILRRRPSHGYRSDLHGPLTDSESEDAVAEWVRWVKQQRTNRR